MLWNRIIWSKNGRKLSGWLAYTFSVSRKKMNSIYMCLKEYYTNWDRTMLLVPLELSFNKKWEVNWRWTLQSGRPLLLF